MSSGQKIVKVFAIGLAIFVIFTICSAILGGISLFCGIMFYDKFEEVDYYEQEKIEEQNIRNLQELRENVKLEVDLEISNLEIRKGEEFSVEKVNMKNNLQCIVKNNTLKIEEGNHHWFRMRNNNNATVIITIPKDIIFHEVDISMGIGRMKIADMKAKDLDIDAGVGIANLDHITAEKANIHGGAGNLNITNSILRNLNLDCGVGVTKIAGEIKGNSKINCGVGKTELNLNGTEEFYKIRTETGLGEITLNGIACANEVYGNGDDYIRIDGGVGKVEIFTK